MASILLAVGIPLSPGPGPATADDVVAWIVTLLALAYVLYECLRPWPGHKTKHSPGAGPHQGAGARERRSP